MTVRLGLALLALLFVQALAVGCVIAPNKAQGTGGGGAGAQTGATAGGGVDAGNGAGADGAGGAAGQAAGDAMTDLPHEPDPTSPPVDCDLHPERCALCSGKYATVSYHRTMPIRGTWQYDPGGPAVALPESGYPCAAFKYEGPVRPTLDDDRWVGAPDATSIVFSTDSNIPTANYRTAQFRYFRSLVYIPDGHPPGSFRVVVTGVDDSVEVILFNSTHPEGVSPQGVGPSDPAVGACNGNGDAAWELEAYARAGEVNLVLIIQADMSPTVSSLGKSDVTVDGADTLLYDCVTGTPPPGDVEPPPPDAGAEAPDAASDSPNDGPNG
jgi:hypothetical protein